MNLLQVIAASDEDEKGKDILDGESEYYKSPLRSQETKDVLKALFPSAFEPSKQYFICLFETAETRCGMDKFKKDAGLKEKKLYSFALNIFIMEGQNLPYKIQKFRDKRMCFLRCLILKFTKAIFTTQFLPQRLNAISPLQMQIDNYI
jgi:hypothetical protein